MPSFACLARKSRKKRSGSFIFQSQKIRFFLIVPAVFLMDRFSKDWITAHFSEGQGMPVIPSIFHITRVHNTGAAFGLLKGLRGLLIGTTLLSVLFLAAYLYRRWDQLKPLNRIGWILIVSGALGNLYDRVFLGYVIDFLDFRIWPVFNAADSAVCIGVFLVFLGLFER